MKNIYRAGLLAMSLLGFALALPARAADTRRCHHNLQGRYDIHGHRPRCVQRSWRRAKAASTATRLGRDGGSPAAAAATSTAAPPRPSPRRLSKSAPTAKAGNTDPTGATAKCKDGTYSKSQHHSGTCSSHGGVAEWLDGQK